MYIKFEVSTIKICYKTDGNYERKKKTQPINEFIMNA